MRNPRWLISFADLCLLLLACFVMLHARGNAAAAGVRAAFGNPVGAAGAEARAYPAAALFVNGEATFRPGAARTFAALGARAAPAHQRVRIESAGREAGSARFDGWELAAARSAALARAVAAGGLAPDRIEIALAPAGGAAGPHVLTVSARK